MRLKFIAGNMIVVLLVGLASYLVVRTQLRSALEKEVDDRISSDAELVSRSWRLSGTELANHALSRASSRPVRQALLNAVGERERRSRAFSAVQGVSGWFQEPARGRGEKPTIVLIADETGSVVARDTDKNRLFGFALSQELPLVASVLSNGAPRFGVWPREDKLLQIGVAAVRNDDGGVVGVLLVGYDLSNGFAQQEAEVLGRDVAFITSEKVYSSSTSAAVREALVNLLYSDDNRAGTQAALSRQRNAPWAAELDGDEYLGMTAALPDTGKLSAGYVVLANKTEKRAPLSSANAILILTLLGLIGVAVYGLIVANSFLNPLEAIEEDVLAVINGRTDVRLDDESPEFGGLAYRINQLINLFTGVAEEDAEGRAVTSSGGWPAVDASGPEIPAASVDSADADPDVAALAAEPEDRYFARLYQEYVAAKQAVGEDVSNISQERFIQRLRGNAEHLMKKHDSRMVRFKVETVGSQVNLKPVVVY